MTDYPTPPQFPPIKLDVGPIVQLPDCLTPCKVGFTRVLGSSEDFIQLYGRDTWQASFSLDFDEWSDVVLFAPNELGEQILTVYLKHNESGEIRSSRIKIKCGEYGEPQIEVLPDKEG